MAETQKPPRRHLGIKWEDIPRHPDFDAYYAKHADMLRRLAYRAKQILGGHSNDYIGTLVLLFNRALHTYETERGTPFEAYFCRHWLQNLWVRFRRYESESANRAYLKIPGDIYSLSGNGPQRANQPDDACLERALGVSAEEPFGIYAGYVEVLTRDHENLADGIAALLPEEWREIFYLRIVKDRSLERVGRRLQISKEAVRKREIAILQWLGKRVRNHSALRRQYEELERTCTVRSRSKPCHVSPSLFLPKAAS